MNNIQNNASNILNVIIKNYTDCGWCSDRTNEEILDIPWSVWSQWLFISQRMGKKEWGAIFWIKDNTITSFKIPQQEINSVECEFKEELGGDGIIHSHHDMGAFHSSQDDTHARNLYQYSIVLSNSEGSICTKRVKLPCGAYGYMQVRLKIIDLPELDFAKIGEKKKEFFAMHPEEKFRQEARFDELEMQCEECVRHDCHSCEIFLAIQKTEAGMSGAGFQGAEGKKGEDLQAGS